MPPVEINDSSPYLAHWYIQFRFSLGSASPSSVSMSFCTHVVSANWPKSMFSSDRNSPILFSRAARVVG